MSRLKGLTIIEIMIVVIVIGILAAIALPKVTAPRENLIASEGMQHLLAIYNAQKRSCLENGIYQTDIAQLDMTVSGSSYFGAPDPMNPANCTSSTGSYVGQLSRAGGPAYTLQIRDDGAILCSGAGCGEAKCNKRGSTFCN